MKIANQAGLVLVAGAVLALTGCNPELPDLAGFSVPPVAGFSVPAVVVGNVPVGNRSAPRCVQVRTPGVAVSVGSASAPTPCTTVTTGGPVGNASAPRCVEVTTPQTTVRRC